MLYEIGLRFILQICVNLGIDPIVPIFGNFWIFKFYMCKMVASCEDLFHLVEESEGSVKVELQTF